MQPLAGGAPLLSCQDLVDLSLDLRVGLGPPTRGPDLFSIDDDACAVTIIADLEYVDTLTTASGELLGHDARSSLGHGARLDQCVPRLILDPILCAATLQLPCRHTGQLTTTRARSATPSFVV